ncbi:ATP-binding protein [Brucepastera parasyntrophica]|uniref:ATP-binding protein n=1 Tax=Brucepastera parasyntrophica TaxID=2880008 RepID=UPI00210BC980|nr:ATP-binding protein [Brucepastera parasyntrophica]ULQ60415.1 ATP-binding protein [Brucepastera parasyntrophica]
MGKTTMLQRLMERESVKREYITLDDLNDRALAKNDPAMFFQLHPPPVFIDEVQYAPELFSYIKIQIDKHHNPGDFWLTGSQLFKLMTGIQESLAGRVALLHLSPLSQQEIYTEIGPEPFTLDMRRLTQRQRYIKPASTPEMFERIFRGGMPALISGQYSDQNRYYSGYISTYLERDVRDLSGTIDSLKFMNFVTSVAARTGQLVNYKGIADDCDIDQTTAKNWLRILETLGIIFYLHPYSNNVLKRTIKTPKLYFYDTGLVCYLTKWSNAETVMNGAMNGALLENYTVSEILKSYHNTGFEPALYYYRDKDSKEIDLLLESDGALHPVEIKKSASPDSRITRVFDVIDRGPLERGTGGVLCMAEKLGAFDSRNLIVPVWLV